MSPRSSAQLLTANVSYTSFNTDCLIQLLKKLDFYLDDTTANDYEWVFRHKCRKVKTGKDYITLPRFVAYNEKLSLIVIDQIKRFGITEQEIMDTGITTI